MPWTQEDKILPGKNKNARPRPAFQAHVLTSHSSKSPAASVEGGSVMRAQHICDPSTGVVWAQPPRPHISHLCGYKGTRSWTKRASLTVRLHWFKSFPKMPFMRSSTVCINFVGRATRKKLGDKWGSYRSLENSWEVSVGCFRDVATAWLKREQKLW